MLKAHASFNCVDLAPSIQNLSLGQLNSRDELITCTVLPNADFYVSLDASDPLSKGRDIHRSVIGEETLMLNGFPTMDTRLEAAFASVSSTFASNLGGNSFPATVIAAFVIAIYFALEQPQVSDKACTSKEEVEDAMNLFKKSRQAS